MTKSLIDTYDRRLNYLRISITDRCNFRCMYCMPDSFQSKLTHNEILTYEEILRVVQIGVDLGISKVRITGGEPLVRKGVYDFLSKLTAIKGLEDISLTTNGACLKQNIGKIQDAGIKRINVSLDSLNPLKFQRITRFNLFQKVWEGIEAADEAGMGPIKINVVAMKGINDNEIQDFGRLSIARPYSVRFIEFMPIGTASKAHKGQYLASADIKKELDQLGTLIPVDSERHDGPAERFRWKNGAGEIGLIHAISKHFCKTCNRLRLTASGGLRPCLLSDYQLDLKSSLRNGCSDAEIADLFLKAAEHKIEKHAPALEKETEFPGRMSAIGG